MFLIEFTGTSNSGGRESYKDAVITELNPQDWKKQEEKDSMGYFSYEIDSIKEGTKEELKKYILETGKSIDDYEILLQNGKIGNFERVKNEIAQKIGYKDSDELDNNLITIAGRAAVNSEATAFLTVNPEGKLYHCEYKNENSIDKPLEVDIKELSIKNIQGLKDYLIEFDHPSNTDEKIDSFLKNYQTKLGVDKKFAKELGFQNVAQLDFNSIPYDRTESLNLNKIPTDVIDTLQKNLTYEDEIRPPYFKENTPVDEKISQIREYARCAEFADSAEVKMRVRVGAIYAYKEAYIEKYGLTDLVKNVDLKGNIDVYQLKEDHGNLSIAVCPDQRFIVYDTNTFTVKHEFKSWEELKTGLKQDEGTQNSIDRARAGIEKGRAPRLYMIDSNQDLVISHSLTESRVDINRLLSKENEIKNQMKTPVVVKKEALSEYTNGKSDLLSEESKKLQGERAVLRRDQERHEHQDKPHFYQFKAMREYRKEEKVLSVRANDLSEREKRYIQDFNNLKAEINTPEAQDKIRNICLRIDDENKPIREQCRQVKSKLGEAKNIEKEFIKEKDQLYIREKTMVQELNQGMSL